MASLWKISSLLLSLWLFNLLTIANGQYVTIGDKYYRPITTQKVNWYRAYQVCGMLGMRLASIETDNEFTELRTYLFSNSLLSNSFWLAGNNLADRSEYVWLSSGRKFSYTKWAPSQPGPLANHCVHTDSNFNWASDACTKAHYILCQKPLVSDCGVYGRCSQNINYLY